MAHDDGVKLYECAFVPTLLIVEGTNPRIKHIFAIMLSNKQRGNCVLLAVI